MDSVGTDSSSSSNSSDSSDSSSSDSSSDSSSPGGSTSQDPLTDTKSVSKPVQNYKKDELLTKEIIIAGNKNIPKEIRLSPNSSPDTPKMKRNLLEIQAPHNKATTANPSNDKQHDIKA
eukprot:scaffold7218_cov215-Chaetoceros_neogracile.AAC.1